MAGKGKRLEELEAQYVRSSNARKSSRADTWDQRAEDWDAKYRREEERAEHEVRIRDAAAWLRSRGLLGPEDDVADIGCGPGRFAAEFARTCRSVLGVDISPRMVGYGEAWCRELGLTNTRFAAVDFASADVAALGWEGRFDLVFSSITPAVSTLQGLENMMRMSRGWCFNASFVYTDDPLHLDIMHTLFSREPRRNKTSHSHWFHELFDLLWYRGYYPETHYYTQRKSVPLVPDRRTAERLTRYLLEEDEVTEEAVRRVQDYLTARAESTGQVTDDSVCRYGWLLWNVKDKAPERG
jgi:SAM-dependent methyltransferase